VAFTDRASVATAGRTCGEQSTGPKAAAAAAVTAADPVSYSPEPFYFLLWVVERRAANCSTKVTRIVPSSHLHCVGCTDTRESTFISYGSFIPAIPLTFQ
jgi:hypothetical protein